MVCWIWDGWSGLEDGSWDAVEEVDKAEVFDVVLGELEEEKAVWRVCGLGGQSVGRLWELGEEKAVWRVCGLEVSVGRLWELEEEKAFWRGSGSEVQNVGRLVELGKEKAFWRAWGSYSR